jgi:hypothetical protein
LGTGNITPGSNAMAFGDTNYASGYASAALNSHTTAAGAATLSSGFYSNAAGDESTALGFFTYADGFNELAIGQCNAGASEDGSSVNRTAWKSTDPLFEIGNGSYAGWGSTPGYSSSDAFVVYKDGNTVVQGKLTSQAGFQTTTASVAATDIPMFGE